MQIHAFAWRLMSADRMKYQSHKQRVIGLGVNEKKTESAVVFEQKA